MVDETIPIRHVADASRSAAWYERLGYTQEWEHRFEPSLPAFVSIARNGAARLFLSEHAGDARPGSLVYIRVPNVDEVAREFTSGVVEQPWAREVQVTDPDGTRLRIGTPRT